MAKTENAAAAGMVNTLGKDLVPEPDEQLVEEKDGQRDPDQCGHHRVPSRRGRNAANHSKRDGKRWSAGTGAVSRCSACPHAR
ncbi:hypothetical protein Ais01nite_59770 [Asanoa ishikariensis]|nr:hypothetical protein Ais01nite_59770 [Asanoa ishikariensis]